MSDDVDAAVLAHFGSGLPGFAHRWAAGVRDGDFDVFWQLTGPDLRLVLAQTFLYGVRTHPFYGGDLPALAVKLAAVQHANEAAVPFFRRATLRTLGDLLPPGDLGVGSQTRLAGIDLESAVLLPLDQLRHDEDGVAQWDGQATAALDLICRWTSDGWQVYGINGGLPRPGWPPAWTAAPGPSVTERRDPGE